jgi:hypothetical protein
MCVLSMRGREASEVYLWDVRNLTEAALARPEPTRS